MQEDDRASVTRAALEWDTNHMKSPFLVSLVPAVFLIGCGQPAGPTNSGASLPSSSRLSTLRLTVENRIKQSVALQLMVGFGVDGTSRVDPGEKLQPSKAKSLSKAIDLRLAEAAGNASNRSQGDVYLVRAGVYSDGIALDGPEAYVAIPTRIAENASVKGGQMIIADKGISVTIGASTLYGAWVPPAR